MSTPCADHIRATADRLADLARFGASPSALAAHALSLSAIAAKVARLERALDEIVADAMEDAHAAPAPTSAPPLLIAIDCASGARTYHHAARR